MASLALRINSEPEDRGLGIRCFDCPESCEFRLGNRCLHYRGSIGPNEQDPVRGKMRRQVVVWRYCPHKREGELAKMMADAGVLL